MRWETWTRGDICHLNFHLPLPFFPDNTNYLNAYLSSEMAKRKKIDMHLENIWVGKGEWFLLLQWLHGNSNANK